MNFELHDIEEAKSHLIKLAEAGTLNFEISKLDPFIVFIGSNIPPDSLKETLSQTIRSFSSEEMDALQKRFIVEQEFDELLYESFRLKKRREMKRALIQLDTDLGEASFDEAVTKAFQHEKRHELKQKLRALEAEGRSQNPPVVSIKKYIKAFSAAASIIVILLIWQPQHSSDKTLFANYTYATDFHSRDDYYAASELIKDQSNLRGEEQHFKNYNDVETVQLQQAVELVKQKDFQKAKAVFAKLKVEKEKNPGLALYLAISQVNTDELDAAINNLEYLNKLPHFSYSYDAKFHLAFAYLKSGERKKAKKVLKEVANSKSKYSDEARQTLENIRWF